MIDFNQVGAAIKFSEEELLSKVDETQVFYYYFGHFELRKTYPSKFRKDSNPSTGFYYNKRNRLTYHDIATGEKLGAVQFVAKLFNLSYYDAIRKIASDFGIIKSNNTPAIKVLNKSIQFDKELKKETLIQIIPGPWEARHIAYWKQYHIDVHRLKVNNVYPIKRAFINKVEIKITDLCFAYIVKSVDVLSKERTAKYHTYIKLYQPLIKGIGKWISNVPISIPFGLYELNYNSNHIAIGKAKKDEMVLQYFFESTIGTQNESESSISEALTLHLCESFPNRTIIWDADQVGVENCKKFNSKGFGYFNTPAYLVDRGIKDVSDYVKAFGMKALERLLISKNVL